LPDNIVDNTPYCFINLCWSAAPTYKKPCFFCI